MEKCDQCSFFDADLKKEEVLKEAEAELSLIIGDTIKQISPKMEASLNKLKLCPECAKAWFYFATAVDLRHTLDQETYVKLLDLLCRAKEYQTYIQLKAVVIDQGKSLRFFTRDIQKHFWRMYVKLFYWGQQPQHVTEVERDLMKSMRKDDYSIGDLAFIFDRSKATIHENLKK